MVYFDFRKAKGTVDMGEGGTAAFNVKTTAAGAGPLLTGSFATDWIGSARLGVAQVRVNVNGDYQGSTAAASDNSTQACFGLGTGYMIFKSLSIDAAYDMTRAKFQGTADNVDMLSIGLTYSF